MDSNAKSEEPSRHDELSDAKPQPVENTTSEELGLSATAHHEAGHAVVAISLGRQIKKATINRANLPTGGVRLGAVMFEKGRSKPTGDWLEDEVMILLAGMVAESSFTGRYCEQGAAVDLRAVDRLFPRMSDSWTNCGNVINKTEHLLSEPAHAAAVKAVAQELLLKGEVSGRLVKQPAINV